ncbi:hypothetical protein [Mucilaginibacter pedocola]|uniref:Uncharacterized protein n=1 Tax=Mucilaginibacter pedocola TaxID=1792845 RepID=A0A1S9PB98_9SPHI|nr:hypothetical protein [Mucilaginibacter pedocola]OOQ58230.1 hypothetical protein BC343_11345 [Mucilaginibacter pedocola]
MIIVSNTELSELYNRAIAGYYRCISDEDNAFLSDEISIPIDEVVLKYFKAKAVFCDNVSKIDSWEVEIILWDESSMIGRYTHIEDDMGNELDDSLVFDYKG